VILGSDLSRQQSDQRVQNAVKNSIAPSALVTLHSVSALGSEVVVIRVPPWNRNDVYQYQEKVYIRKGTNAFGASPEEMKSLHRGVAVI
jgi:predicted HTH transcriptional regulator